MTAGGMGRTRREPSARTLLAYAALFAALAVMNAIEFAGAMREDLVRGISHGDWLDLALAVLLTGASIHQFRAWIRRRRMPRS